MKALMSILTISFPAFFVLNAIHGLGEKIPETVLELRHVGICALCAFGSFIMGQIYSRWNPNE